MPAIAAVMNRKTVHLETTERLPRTWPEFCAWVSKRYGVATVILICAVSFCGWQYVLVSRQLAANQAETKQDLREQRVFIQEELVGLIRTSNTQLKASTETMNAAIKLMEKIEGRLEK